MEVSSEPWLEVQWTEGAAIRWELLNGAEAHPLDRTTFLVPQSLLEGAGSAGVLQKGSWRRVVVALAAPHTPALAAASLALAEVGVDARVFSTTRGLVFFVPQGQWGRALAALRQARLDQFQPAS
ncbi:MAG: hypothetical protein N2447_01165 [Thermoanaerobaculum sp.]|nr:hypothetical protein [Thermoanaerobaculum sp.]